MYSKLFESSIKLICLSLFLYQSWQLLYQYLQGYTITNILLGQNTYDRPPAITICPGKLELKKTAKISFEYDEVYNNWKNNNNKSIYQELEDEVYRDLQYGNVTVDDVLNRYTYS